MSSSEAWLWVVQGKLKLALPNEKIETNKFVDLQFIDCRSKESYRYKRKENKMDQKNHKDMNKKENKNIKNLIHMRLRRSVD